MNEESSDTTFKTQRGASNIDLTIVTFHLLKKVKPALDKTTHAERTSARKMK
jgi:hypothetical protein